MKVVLLKPNGDSAAEVSVEPADRVLRLRKQVSTATGIPLPVLKLLWNGDMLKDKFTLEEIGYVEGEAMMLIQEPTATLSLLPGFAGVYRGQETEGDGRHVYEMVLDSLLFEEDCEAPDSGQAKNAEGVPAQCVKGLIHWRYLRGWAYERTGRRARELVRGRVLQNGDIILKGYEKQELKHTISCCKYTLRISEDGENIRGSFQFKEEGSDGNDADFTLQKLSEEKEEEWRTSLEADPWGEVLSDQMEADKMEYEMYSDVTFD